MYLKEERLYDRTQTRECIPFILYLIIAACGMTIMRGLEKSDCQRTKLVHNINHVKYIAVMGNIWDLMGKYMGFEKQIKHLKPTYKLDMFLIFYNLGSMM